MFDYSEVGKRIKYYRQKPLFVKVVVSKTVIDCLGVRVLC